MRLEGLYLRHDYFIEVCTTLFDTLDLNSGKCQSFDDLRYRMFNQQKLFQPTQRQFHVANWAKNRWSFSINRRISGKPNKDIAKRSSPIPNANPVQVSGSYALSARLRLTAWNTVGLTIPHPKSSIHLPSWIPGDRISSSKLGSVNGKKCGRSRVCTSWPNSSRTKYSKVPLRSATLTLRSTYSPSS